MSGLQNAARARVSGHTHGSHGTCHAWKQGTDQQRSYPTSVSQEQYKSMGDEVKKSNLDAMRDQMSLFKSKLEEFAIQVGLS